MSGPENGATILLAIFDGSGVGGPTREFDERFGIERIRGTRGTVRVREKGTEVSKNGSRSEGSESESGLGFRVVGDPGRDVRRRRRNSTSGPKIGRLWVPAVVRVRRTSEEASAVKAGREQG